MNNGPPEASRAQNGAPIQLKFGNIPKVVVFKLSHKTQTATFNQQNTHNQKFGSQSILLRFDLCRQPVAVGGPSKILANKSRD